MPHPSLSKRSLFSFSFFPLYIVICSLFWASGCRRTDSDCMLRIYAASSLTLPLQKIGKTFRRRTGCSPQFDFASSGILRRKIERGAPASVYISAGSFQMQKLLERKGQQSLQPISFISNRLVLVVPRNTQHTAFSSTSGVTQWLLRPKHRLAMGDPRHVPAGRYARHVLSKMNIWKTLRKHAVYTQHVRAALHIIRRGHLTGAIVFQSDAYSARKFVRTLYTFPTSLHSPILYQAVVLTRYKPGSFVARWMRHLQSNASLSTLYRFGFLPRTKGKKQ